MSLRTDAPIAVRDAWLIVSLIGGAVLTSAVILPPEVYYGLLPECEAQARGSSCVLCGMTTGFLEIAGGNFHAAQQSNAGATPLFAALFVNFIAAVAYSVSMFLRHHDDAGGHNVCS